MNHLGRLLMPWWRGGPRASAVGWNYVNAKATDGCPGSLHWQTISNYDRAVLSFEIVIVSTFGKVEREQIKCQLVIICNFQEVSQAEICDKAGC